MNTNVKISFFACSVKPVLDVTICHEGYILTLGIIQFAEKAWKLSLSK